MLDEGARVELKVAIVRLGKHQYEVAHAIGVNENRLSQFLCGRRSLPPDKLTRLEEVLGLTPVAVPAEGPDDAV
jgi:plasmid maintenance system antidote protein VapI